MQKQKNQSFIDSALLLVNQTPLFSELVNSTVIEGEMKRKKEKNMEEIRSLSWTTIAWLPVAL